MSKQPDELDEIAVWFDASIGHGQCPADETEENCKYTELTQLISDRETKARMDELEYLEDAWFHTDTVKRFERKLVLRRQATQKRLAQLNSNIGKED